MAKLREPQGRYPLPEAVVDRLLDIAPSCILHNDARDIGLPVLTCAHAEDHTPDRYTGCVECKEHCAELMRSLVFEA